MCWNRWWLLSTREKLHRRKVPRAQVWRKCNCAWERSTKHSLRRLRRWRCCAGAVEILRSGRECCTTQALAQRKLGRNEDALGSLRAAISLIERARLLSISTERARAKFFG